MWQHELDPIRCQSSALKRRTHGGARFEAESQPDAEVAPASCGTIPCGTAVRTSAPGSPAGRRPGWRSGFPPSPSTMPPWMRISPPGGRVGNRVVEQVVENDPEQCRVARRGDRRGGEIACYLHSALFEKRQERLQAFRQDSCGVDLLQARRSSFLADAGECGKTFHQVLPARRRFSGRLRDVRHTRRRRGVGKAPDPWSRAVRRWECAVRGRRGG